MITPGSKIGSYEIIVLIGAGGMGEVYRARDTRLNRDVALKVLPEVFARDPQRMARFEREAKLLAALNHSNIAAIYGLEESGGTQFLVLELVEGETLAEFLPGSAGVLAGTSDAATAAMVLFHTGSFDHRAKHAWDGVQTVLRVFARLEVATTVPGSRDCALARFTDGLRGAPTAFPR